MASAKGGHVPSANKLNESSTNHSLHENSSKEKNQIDGNTRSTSYAAIMQRHQFPTKEQGLIMDCVDGLTLTDYTCAIGDIVKPVNILNASKISNNRIRLFLSSKKLVDEITAKYKYIPIGEASVTVRPLVSKQQRVIISNVCPTIPHYVLEELIDGLNIRRSSPISSLRATIAKEGYSHVLSDRRQMYINPEDVVKLPEIIKITHDDTLYYIYPSTDTIKCFLCKLEGHIAKQCPRANSDNQNNDLRTQVVNSSVTQIPEIPAAFENHYEMSASAIEHPNTSNPIGLIEFDRPRFVKSVQPLMELDQQDDNAADKRNKKRQLSLSSSASSSLIQNKELHLSLSESSLESLNEKEQPKNKELKAPTPKKVRTEKVEKVNQSIELSTLMQEIKPKIEDPVSNFPLNYQDFINFLDQAFLNPSAVLDIANAFLVNVADLINMMRTLHPNLPSSSLKRKFTSIIKKLDKSLSEPLITNSEKVHDEPQSQDKK